MAREPCVTQEEDECCLLSQRVNFFLDCVTFQCCRLRFLEINLHGKKMNEDKKRESMPPIARSVEDSRKDREGLVW